MPVTTDRFNSSVFNVVGGIFSSESFQISKLYDSFRFEKMTYVYVYRYILSPQLICDLDALLHPRFFSENYKSTTISCIQKFLYSNMITRTRIVKEICIFFFMITVYNFASTKRNYLIIIEIKYVVFILHYFSFKVNFYIFIKCEPIFCIFFKIFFSCQKTSYF